MYIVTNVTLLLLTGPGGSRMAGFTPPTAIPCSVTSLSKTCSTASISPSRYVGSFLGRLSGVVTTMTYHVYSRRLVATSSYCDWPTVGGMTSAAGNLPHV